MLLPNGLECYYLSKEETEYIFQEVFTGEHYLRNGLFIHEGDCIFDVGANIGLFTLFVNQLQKKDVKIYAFEPVKPIFDVLKENINLHSIPNAFLLNYGFSFEDTHSKMFTFYPHLAGNSTTKPDEKLQQKDAMYAVLDKELVEYLYQDSEQICCELRTLSSAISELGIQSIDLLKIDVEGDEYAVLQGIKQEDWSKIKQICVEVHDIEGRLEAIHNLLKSYKFDITIEKNDLVPPNFNNYNLYAVRS